MFVFGLCGGKEERARGSSEVLEQTGRVYRSVHRGSSEARLLVLGDGLLEQVGLAETGRWFDLGAERQRLADRACQDLRERGMTVTADPIYRVVSWTVGERFDLLADRGDYSQVVGTKTHPEWGVKAQVVAVCCATECPQGFIIEKRSARVAALPGMWHVCPAGSLQPPNGPHATLLAEAREELGLQAAELRDVRCVGMLYSEHSGVYQLACSMSTEVPLTEIEARLRSGRWEQDGFVCAPVCPELLPLWLDEYSSKVTPGGRAALLAEGLRRWGEEWFDRHCKDAA